MIQCGTVLGWHSGRAFGSDTKGRGFKSLKIKDLLSRVVLTASKANVLLGGKNLKSLYIFRDTLTI